MPYQVWVWSGDDRPTKLGEPHKLRGDALNMLSRIADVWSEFLPLSTDSPHAIASGCRVRGNELDLIWVEVF